LAKEAEEKGYRNGVGVGVYIVGGESEGTLGDGRLKGWDESRVVGAYSIVAHGKAGKD
jgi:hypothetical protein